MSDPFVLQREAASAPFVANVGESSLSFRPFSDLDAIEIVDLIERAEQMGDVEFKVAILRLAATDEDFAALKALRLTAKEMSSLYAAYTAHTGANEGESPASSD